MSVCIQLIQLRKQFSSRKIQLMKSQRCDHGDPPSRMPGRVLTKEQFEVRELQNEREVKH